MTSEGKYRFIKKFFKTISTKVCILKNPALAPIIMSTYSITNVSTVLSGDFRHVEYGIMKR
jgi:hypothetical protein